MTARSIISPEDQKVTFVELFFDLVFVFCITQFVGLLHEEPSWRAVGEAALVFWLVWWAWTQFTWALNAADTTHPLIELATLAATGLAFLLAVGIPDAFHGHALAFALPYVLIRLFGLTLYAWVAATNARQLVSVLVFGALSLGGLAAVLAGAWLGGAAQYVAWGAAIALDVVAAMIGASLEGWDLHPEHFVERHGLFVIIALGESLIVAAGGLTGHAWDASRVTVAVLAVAGACALWWTYFTRAKPWLDHAMETVDASLRAPLARSAFSLLHFPLLAGVIAFAAAIEHAMRHASEPLALPIRGLLAAGLLLFVGGTAAAVWRATRRTLFARCVTVATTAAAIVLVEGRPPSATLAIALAGVGLVAVLEHGVELPEAAEAA